MSDLSFRRIDIHAHLQSPEFDADREVVCARALEQGTAVINIGTNLQSSLAAVNLADRYPVGMYAAIGLHPTELGEVLDISRYRQLAMNPKVVGIGECGLDYFRLDKDTSVGQKERFSAQIALANEVGKPLMLHIRDAYDDALEILKSESRVKGNSHFFAGTVEQARGFLDIGYTLSFTGVITFARQYQELIEYVPLDMIQAETDCPFVAPVPYRGQRNESAYVTEVIAKMAEIKKLAVSEVESALMANARRIWGLKL